MPSLSFRTKLILTMSLIVISVTGATTFVTQKRVSATYQRLFEEQFDLQISFFTESRKHQFDEISKKCESIASSDSLIGAMETALQSGDAKGVYESVFLQLEDVIHNSEKKLPNLQNLKPLENLRQHNLPQPPSSRNSNLPTIAVVDMEGRVLESKDARASFMKRLAQENSNATRNTQLKIFIQKKPGEFFTQQRIGYLATDRDSDKVELREVIVTPITHPTSGKMLGALVMGYLVKDFGEKAMYEFSQKKLLSGIWLDGKIYSQTIPEEIRDEVSQQIQQKLESSNAHSKEYTANLEGIPHRMFFKVLNPDSPFPTTAQVCFYSMADAIAEEHDLRNKIMGFGSAALCLGILAVLFISHGLSKPIVQLVSGIQNIRLGNFDAKVPVQGHDEFAMLAQSFNDMTADLALKERYKAVLSQLADHEVADQLVSGHITLGGELRHVSVLFCDIRGFTALTENMPPQEVIQLLNEHMTALNRIAHEYHGMVDKFVGDLLMVVFGAPKTYGRDSLHATRCALAMMQERQRLNQTAKHHLEIGIGIATGEAVAGCMGSTDRMNYTVLGERVNLASRLCSIASGMEILVDQTTMQELGSLAEAETIEPMQLKGFSEPVPAYRLLSIEQVSTKSTMLI